MKWYIFVVKEIENDVLKEMVSSFENDTFLC